MRPHWKRVAECADNPSFTPQQVNDALLSALTQDCRDELTPGFLDSFAGVYGTLFHQDIETQLEGLRSEAGVGLGRTVLDYALQQAAQGQTGHDAAAKALAAAVADRGARCARQMEEHYCRKSTEPRALNIRERIEQALSAGPKSVARQMLKLEPRSVGRTPRKRQGLDDGVAR
jgi:hypothetical protein